VKAAGLLFLFKITIFPHGSFQPAPIRAAIMLLAVGKASSSAILFRRSSI
jgi:hypothetical protein